MSLFYIHRKQVTVKNPTDVCALEIWKMVVGELVMLNLVEAHLGWSQRGLGLINGNDCYFHST